MKKLDALSTFPVMASIETAWTPIVRHDHAVAKRITVDGLPDQTVKADRLAEFFRDNATGGPVAFFITAGGFKGFYSTSRSNTTARR